MKKVVNKIDRKLILDLNTFDDSRRRNSLQLRPGESSELTEEELRSRQVVKAIKFGSLGVEECPKAKKSSSSKKSKKDEDKEEKDSNKEKVKIDEEDTNNSKSKKINKEDK